MSGYEKVMTDKQKSFWSGTIVTAMVVALTGVLTWGLLKAAHVPALEAKTDQQFKNLNQNLMKLTSTNKATNNKLDGLTYQISEFSKALIVSKVELEQLKEDCDYNTKVIRENKHNHKTDYTK